MTDFVLEYKEKYKPWVHYEMICNYAQFLKQPLTLGMFIACDLEGNVLDFEVYQGYVIIGSTREAKKSKIDRGDIYGFFIYDGSKYQQAKERVLFKGFELHGDIIVYDEQDLIGVDQLHDMTIEILHLCGGDNIKLTESAIKQIGL